MKILYIRSSSYNRWDFCPLLYTAEYGCGIVGLSGKKADKGTIVHKIMENIAILSKKRASEDFKETYKYDIDKMIRSVYTYYTSRLTHHEWTESDFHDCSKWTKKALEYNHGQFNPLNLCVVEPECKFDITIKKPWAKYCYEIDGKQVSGYLGIKGTVDYVGQVDKDIYECVDYKTGKRINWATGKIKKYEDFKHDPQLRIYHYAMSKIFPNIKYIVMTIFYINDGGAYSICFEEDDLKETEQIIKDRFLEIKSCTDPPQYKSWKCNKLCFCGKNSFKVLNQPTLSHKQTSSVPISICEQLKYEIQEYGIDTALARHRVGNFSIAKYKNPGEV